VVGRESGQVRLEVIDNADRVTLEGGIEGTTLEGTTVSTDEWGGYNHLEAMHRGHATVCHAAGEWARDDDGDGLREVHDNTLEGLWTGLRNFLRMFRGVSKWFLAPYVAIFQWGYNLKAVNNEFLRTLLGIPFSTIPAS